MVTHHGEPAVGGVGQLVETYTLAVAAGKTATISIAGGTGDADLYVRAGSAPTTSSYTCRPYKTGNAETCTLTPTSATTYYIRVVRTRRSPGSP